MMTTRMPRRSGAAALLAVALGAAGAPATLAEDGGAAAAEYCTSVGGEVQERTATWNTNGDPSTWVDLGRTMQVCRFKATDEAGSRIYVELDTLYSDHPTLAVGAYLAEVPMSSEPSQGNPATRYCADLGGSSSFGTGAAGGGWVNTDDPDDVVVAMCVFPDLSAIDEWGIAYHSEGTVRGADLVPLLRSDSADYPPFLR